MEKNKSSRLLETFERLQTEQENTLFKPVTETVFDDLEHKCVFTLLPLDVTVDEINDKRNAFCLFFPSD